MNEKHINPVYAIGAVALIGGLAGSFLWTQAANLGTQFDLESRLAASENSIVQKGREEAPQSSVGGTSTGGYVTPATSQIKYDTDGALLVRYTDSGFLPSTINASLRQVIRFRNDASGAMRIAPNESVETAEYYGELRQSSSVGKGGEYEFTANKTGVFPFLNLNNKEHTGLLVVTP